jgi:hypothetical protein
MVTKVARPTRTAVQLDWSDEDGEIVVTPHDESRFMIKMRRAIQILQIGDRMEQFQQQFQLLLRELAQWLVNRHEVAAAYITLRDGNLAFVVQRALAEYDEAFEDDLSDLDCAIASDADLDLIKLDVMGLPNVSEEALQSFLDPNFQLMYSHGK